MLIMQWMGQNHNRQLYLSSLSQKIKDAESLSTQNQQKIYIIYYESIYMCVNDLIQDIYNLQHGKLLLTTIDLKARYCRLPRLG